MFLGAKDKELRRISLSPSLALILRHRYVQLVPGGIVYKLLDSALQISTTESSFNAKTIKNTSTNKSPTSTP